MPIDFAILPELVLASTAVLVLVVDLFVERAKVVASWLSIAGTVVAGIALASLVGAGTRSTFGGSFVVDNYALLFKGCSWARCCWCC